VDMSKLSTGQIVAAVGGALLIISLFLDWISGVTFQLGATSVGGGGVNAWDAFSGMDWIMLLIGLAALALAFAGITGSEAAGRLPSWTPWVVSLLGVCIFGWALGWDLENENAGLGAWLALIASGAIAYGGYASAIESAQPPTRRRAAAPPPPATRSREASSTPSAGGAPRTGDPGAGASGSTPPPGSS
jgi:hypothetical protein